MFSKALVKFFHPNKQVFSANESDTDTHIHICIYYINIGWVQCDL